MLKVFIAEDEEIIRLSLRKQLAKLEKEGSIHFVGEASDGDMALSMMQELKPDLLLTDIRMPFMNGLDLARYAKEMLPWLHVIIISGYDDFAYSQEAIAIGVDSYITKPVTTNELTSAILASQKQIQQEREWQKQPDQKNKILHFEYYKEHFFHHLEKSGYEPSELIERQEKLNFNLLGQYLTALYVKLPQQHLNEENYQHLILRFNESFGSDKSVLSVIYDTLTIKCLVSGATEAKSMDKAYYAADILKYELQSIEENAFVIAIGNTSNRLTELRNNLLVTQQFAIDNLEPFSGKIIRLADLLNIEDAKFILPDKTLLNLNQDFHVTESINAILQGLETENGFSSAYAYQVAQYLMKFLEKLDTSQGKKVLVEYQESDLVLISKTPSVYRLLLEVLLTAIKNGLKEKSYQKKDQEHPVVTAVYKEILGNYSDPNLSLQVAADNAGVSLTYLSTLFSQTKGQTFIDALTEIRLNHAKELLKETDLLITAIAFEIGYNDPNYFSYLFKKKVGISPKAFRAEQKK